ncbi:MAG: S8 family serine peptidase [Actinomycetota bacterium]|nr:S8 family serine peptidase [Actinomycetota bacterium]
MRRLVLAAATLCAVAGVVALSSAAGRAPAPPGSSLTIAAAPGRTASVSRALARLGAPVTARAGRLLQVREAPGLAARLARLPGVRGVGPADVAVPDQVISQGVERIGADALQSHGLNGAGIRIAIVDLGFGASWQSLLAKELPPPTQIDATQSFDHTSGRPDIEGLSNAEEPTGHGANVAQVVWDIAPGARYTFVNYHTELELSQAVDWLINGPDGKPRVDIVVHSNSFLDGPFDGTGVAAQAVNRAHDAGIFWANSAGNYARRHWEGVAGDPDKDGWSNIGPAGRGYLTFPLTAGIGMGATLFWSNCSKNGAPVAASTASFQLDVTDTAPSSPVVFAQGQKDAAQPASAVGFLPTSTGTYGLRILQGTPGVVCNLEIFGGGVELGDEATVESSIPTPGDARGSFTVGARDWQGDAAADYSSQGPTEDGRLKPDVVAPASTAVWPGIAMVGTSASAPHAAGAAALLMQRDRAAGQPSDPDTIARELTASALDIAPPGPDEVTGAGRIRLDLDPPTWVATTPATGEPVGDSSRFDISVDDAGTIEASGVSIDGVAVAEVAGLLHQRLDMSALAPGPHTAVFWARDMAGNRSEQSVSFVRDTTAPTVALSSNGDSLDVEVADAESRTGSLTVQIDDVTGALHLRRTLPLTFTAGAASARIATPALARGRVRVRVQAFDEVGHASHISSASLAPGPR